MTQKRKENTTDCGSGLWYYIVMKKTVHLKKEYFQAKRVLLALVFLFSITAVFPSQADLICDVPEPGTVSETLPKETKAQGGVVLGDRPTVLMEEVQTLPAEPVTEAAPVVQETAPQVQETAPAETEAVQAGPVVASVPSGISGNENGVTGISGTPMTAETQAAPAPSVSSVSGNSIRVSLGFELAMPVHEKSGFKVSRAEVKLSDGTWQKFGYEDALRYPYYRILSRAVSGSGRQSLVAAASAKKFGEGCVSDDVMKKELYLDAEDCAVTNTIDIPAVSETRIRIVQTALSLLGKQYTYGGNGPEAFDCSGLVKYVFDQAGIDVPRTSSGFVSMNGQISERDLRPGDVLARYGHCGIYIGNGIFVHSSDSTIGVVADYLSVYNTVSGFTSYINVIGD